MWARLSVFSGGFDLEAAEEVCSGDEILARRRPEPRREPGQQVDRRPASRRPSTRLPGTRCWRASGSTAPSALTDAGPGAGAAAPAPRPLPVPGAAVRRRGLRPAPGRLVHPAPARVRQHPGGPGVLPRPSQARPPAAFDIAAPIWNFWFAGFLREGYRYLIRALDLATEPTSGRAYALWAASYLAMFATDFDRNATMLAECTEIAAGLDDDLLQARIKECQGHATLYQGDLPGAIELLRAGPPGVPGAREPARRVRHVDPAHRVHLLPRRPQGRRVQPAGPGAGGAARRAVVDGLRALERRHRAVARRRLRPRRPVRCGSPSGCSCRCTT